jgi:hypothetical protein
MAITDTKKSKTTVEKVPSSAANVAVSVIQCELKRGEIKTVGRAIVVEKDTLKFFEDLAETQDSRLYGKLINDALRYLKGEMNAGRLKVHFTK